MFFIRADGNARIGAGHLIRCLTIGAEVLACGEELLFLCADEQSASLAGQQGFRTYVLHTDYRDMEAELPVWEKLLAQWQAEQKGGVCRPVILVDSYYVTDRYLQELRRFGTVALMDDMGRKAYPVDVVVNYNAPALPESYKKLYDGRNTRLLVGSRYTPLRKQFQNREYAVKDEVKAVLITTGGGDSENIAGKLLRALYDRKLEYHLAAGQFNPHLQELRRLGKDCTNIRIHCNVDDMAGLMSLCDIAVTAGGSTVYELASLGIPFICFSYAENQEALTEYIGTCGIAGFAGAFHKAPEETLERLKRVFRELLLNRALRREYSESEKALIDGQGAARLARALTVK